MAIYIGNKHVTGSTSIYIGSHNTPTIHIGSFKTYPENVTYTLSSVTQHYSAGSTIYASGSNYGYITANVYAWQGGDLIWSAASQTLSLTKVSGDGAFSVSGTSRAIASDRETTTGSSRSAVFYGYYGSGSGSAKTSNITFTQEANAITNSNYDPQEYYVDISIGSGVNAAGGSSIVTTYATHKARNLYTSGHYSSLSNRTDTATVTEISDPNNRYSYSNGTLSHESMGKNTTTDSCTLRATNGTATQEASISVTNTYSDTWNNPVVGTFTYPTTIPASGGTAFATLSVSQSGTRTWTSGASEGLTNNAFSYSYAMTSSGRWTMSEGAVSASTRGTVTGNTETSPTVTVTATAYSKSGTATATATQAANTSTYRKQNTGWTAMTNVATCSSDGGTYFVLGPYTYEDWYHYTSGADSAHVTHSTVATATSYSNLTSWISVVSSPSYALNVASNGTTSGRTHTLTATYDGMSRQVEVSQYRAPYDTYEYRIASCGISPQSIASGASGANNCITITATTQYKKTHWKDGQTTSGSWSAYTDTNYCNVRFSGTTGHWVFYDGTSTSTSPMPLTYDANNVGKVYAYATSTNTNQGDLTQNVIIVANTASTAVTLTHKGYGNVSISINPTSSTFYASGGTKTFTVTSNVTGWTVSDSESWLSTSVNGNTVTVSASSYTNTATTRSGTVSVNWSGTTYATYTATQSAYVPPEPSIPGIDKLYSLGDGWIVGRYILSTSQTPYVYQIVIVRQDAGSNTHFSFSSDGYYNTHTKTTTTPHNWLNTPLVQYGINYTAGTTFHTTDAQGTVIDCYGVSVAGAVGQNAETNSAYAGITMS